MKYFFHQNLFIMKNRKVSQLCLTIILIIAGYGNAYAQVPDIYLVDYDNSDTSNVVSFNYETQESKILFSISPRLIATDGCSAFDPFRKIIYYMTVSTPCGGGPVTWHVSKIDLLNKIHEEIFIIEGDVAIMDLQYDFFSNSLIMRGDDSLLFYNPINSELISAQQLPLSGNVGFGSHLDIYNMNTRTYLYRTILISDSETSLITVKYR